MLKLYKLYINVRELEKDPLLKVKIAKVTAVHYVEGILLR
jgi:hypothetical protein